MVFIIDPGVHVERLERWDGTDVVRSPMASVANAWETPGWSCLGLHKADNRSCRYTQMRTEGVASLWI
jgi:hypothetical protein